jgi:prevent-host-death family protein
VTNKMVRRGDVNGVNLADAKARLSELVDLAQRGEEVAIMKRGRPVARIVPITAPKRRIALADMQKATDGWSPQDEGAGAFMRRMRDAYRY